MRQKLSPAGVAARLASLGVLVLAGCASAPQPVAAPAAHGWTKSEVSDSYIFGYPLVVMTSARAVAKADELNVLQRAQRLPSTDDIGLPPGVETDMLVSRAWLDLGNGPVALSLPATGGRYLDARVLDLWTNVVWSTGTPDGTRPSTTKRRLIVFVPPGWSGTLPHSAERVEAPGTSLWLAVRTAATSPGALRTARRLADEVKLEPLAALVEATHHGRARPVKDRRARRDARDTRDEMQSFADTPGVQAGAVASLHYAKTFFERLANALRDNPPSPPDSHALEILADLGVRPGEPVDLPPGAGDAIKAGMADAHTRLATAPVNTMSAGGWTWVGDDVGRYGDDYALRAYVTYTRPGSGTRDEEVVATASTDGDGAALDGEHRYVLHFPARGLPPVRAFWTLTAYTADGAIVGTRVWHRALESNNGLRHERDGSVEIYVQKAFPGRAHQSNWVPVPEGPFRLVMRLYAPRAQAVDGRWQPPALVRK